MYVLFPYFNRNSFYTMWNHLICISCLILRWSWIVSSTVVPWCNGQHFGLWIQWSEFKSRWDLLFYDIRFFVILRVMMHFIDWMAISCTIFVLWLKTPNINSNDSRTTCRCIFVFYLSSELKVLISCFVCIVSNYRISKFAKNGFYSTLIKQLHNYRICMDINQILQPLYQIMQQYYLKYISFDFYLHVKTFC